MYTFDGYSTPITIVVVGAYFPSIPLFDFYSIRLSTNVYSLYTAGKLALRPIKWSHFYLIWCTTPGAVGLMDSDDALSIQTPLLLVL